MSKIMDSKSWKQMLIASGVNEDRADKIISEAEAKTAKPKIIKESQGKASPAKPVKKNVGDIKKYILKENAVGLFKVEEKSKEIMKNLVKENNEIINLANHYTNATLMKVFKKNYSIISKMIKEAKGFDEEKSKALLEKLSYVVERIEAALYFGEKGNSLYSKKEIIDLSKQVGKLMEEMSFEEKDEETVVEEPDMGGDEEIELEDETGMEAPVDVPEENMEAPVEDDMMMGDEMGEEEVDDFGASELDSDLDNDFEFGSEDNEVIDSIENAIDQLAGNLKGVGEKIGDMVGDKLADVISDSLDNLEISIFDETKMDDTMSGEETSEVIEDNKEDEEIDLDIEDEGEGEVDEKEDEKEEEVDIDIEEDKEEDKETLKESKKKRS